MLPATPPSLVKFLPSPPPSPRARGSTVPTSDHVPELMNARPSCGKGMPATAEPGIVAGRGNHLGVRQAHFLADFRTQFSQHRARLHDGREFFQAQPERRESIPSTSFAVRTSSNCVVLASVYSAAVTPVSRYWKYSGRVSQRAARSHSSGNSSTCATNW